MNLTDTLKTAVSALHDGGLVIVPTDTVYGLAANANNGAAVQALCRLKQRAPGKPFSLLIADLAMAKRYGVFDARALALAAHFWPGALTLIVPKRGDASLCPAVNCNGASIGLRVPAHVKTRALIAQFGEALAAPSANVASQDAPSSLASISSEILAGARVCIDGGPCTTGMASTLVDLTSGHLRILRQGSLDHDDIQNALIS